MVENHALKVGLVHYYYGTGAGKTSIALGHILRALGRNLRVVVIQFLKRHDPSNSEGFYYGEYIMLTEKLHIPVYQFGDFKFLMPNERIPDKYYSYARQGLEKVNEIFKGAQYDLIILDEIATMVKLGLLNAVDIVTAIQNRNAHTEVIMTGRDFIPELEKIADYLTELAEKRHPYQKGIYARAGIEY